MSKRGGFAEPHKHDKANPWLDVFWHRFPERKVSSRTKLVHQTCDAGPKRNERKNNAHQSARSAQDLVVDPNCKMLKKHNAQEDQNVSYGWREIKAERHNHISNDS